MASAMADVNHLSYSSTPPASPALPQGDQSSLRLDQNVNPQQPNNNARGGPAAQANRHSSTSLNPRSCITCRKRKVRCDKAQPCSNCIRAQIPCQFPAPGRAPRRPRKPPDSELLARLHKLEGVVKSLGADADDGTLPTTRGSNHERTFSERAHATREDESRLGLSDEKSNRDARSIDSSMGRLVLDEGKSRYVANSFWANLCAEVDDLKECLHENSDECQSPIESPALSPVSEDQAFIFHHASPARDVPLVHPPPDLIDMLWRSFEENVDPLAKMLHLPTMRKHVEMCKTAPATLTRGVEALMFSIYYTAVSSLTPEECVREVGESHQVLASTYRRSAERALARANFLISEEFTVVQAFFFFMLTLRRYEDPRVLWTLMGLLVRIAITMGLHRDGSNFGLSLFDSEMRRRIWWQIVNLDIRLAEDHGSDVTILELLSDTKFPLNLHDKNFQPDMDSSLRDEQGVTDMTFSLIRFEVSYLLRRLSYVPPPTRKIEGENHDPTVRDKERWVEDFQHRLEEKYIRHCDLSIPMHWVISTISRVIYCKMWLTIYQPFQRLDGGVGLPQQTRDRLFDASLECLEYSTATETDMRMEKWLWLFKSISHWHALAYLLNELCHRTKGPAVERAWRAVDATVELWNARLTHAKKDHLWRPLRKLMKKAQAAREREQALSQALSDNPASGGQAQGRSATFGGQGSSEEQSDSSRTAPARASTVDDSSLGRRTSSYTDGSSLTNATSLSSSNRAASRPDPFSPAWISLSGSACPPGVDTGQNRTNSRDPGDLSSSSSGITIPQSQAISSQWSGFANPSVPRPNNTLADPRLASKHSLDALGQFRQSRSEGLPQTQARAGFSSHNFLDLTTTNNNNNNNNAIDPTRFQNQTYQPFAPNNSSNNNNASAQPSFHNNPSQQPRPPQVPDFSDPMVSGADIDPDLNLDLDTQNWADWGEMIREFEMDDLDPAQQDFDGQGGGAQDNDDGAGGEAATFSSTGFGGIDVAPGQGMDQQSLGGGSYGNGIGFAAGGGMGTGTGMGIGTGMSTSAGNNMTGVSMGSNGGGGGSGFGGGTGMGMGMNTNDGNGATLQKVGSNQRRARMGDSWFWL